MLKKPIDLSYHIDRYLVDANIEAIDVDISTGEIVDKVFISDGRPVIKLSIANLPGSPEMDMGDGNVIPAVEGRDWFNEAAAFRQVDHPEYIGMNDYEYNKTRLWKIITEMGLLSGEII